MSSIIKTRTQGFRVSTFRNQEVHKYYSHLQSVMRTIDSNGTYNELFAKPEIDAMAVGETEIEWTCTANGKAVHISQLSESERNRFEKMVSDAFTHIEAYIAENRTKSGKNRDYAQFLSIVGKRPDSNQIWVINGKPIIVQWGFVDENGLMGSSGIYSDWDSFIKDIRKVEPEKPKEEPVIVAEEPAKAEPVNEAVVAAPAAASSLFAEQEKVVEKTAEPAPQSKPEEPKEKPVEKKEEPAPKKVDTEEKKTVYAGLGGYEWVKWVAILLAIIILLLLLLRLLFPPKFPNDLLGQNGTNIGAINGGGMGGSGGGSDGGGAGGGDNGGGAGGGGGQGGDNGAGGQNGGGNPAINPNEPCPVCSKPFGNHGPEDYKKCIRQASKGNGAGQQGGANGAGGNGAGSDQNGIAGGDGQGSPSGAGSSNGGGQGGSDSAGASNGGGQGGSDGAGSNGGGQSGSNGAGNGAGSGSPAGSDQNGITGGAGQGSPSGANGTGEKGTPCDSCGGSGVDTNTGKPCPTCNGTGNGSSGSSTGSDQKAITDGAGQGNPSGANGTGEKGTPCDSCGGSGVDTNTGKPCPTCNGTGNGNSGSPSSSEQKGITGGAGQGNPSDANSTGENAGESGNSEGNGSGSGNDGKSAGSSEKGSGDEKAVEPSKQQKDDHGFNPEDICPVCSRQFKLHSEEDLKNCILASQRDKIEVQKKFERLKSATTNYNKAVKELNSDNSADNIGEK